MNEREYSPQPTSSCLEFLVLMLVTLVSGGVVIGRHLSVFFTTLTPEKAQTAALVGVGIQFLVLSPLLLPLAIFWASPRRKFYQVMLLAHGLGLLFSVGFLLDPKASQLQAFIQLLLGLIYLAFLQKLTPRLSKPKAAALQADLAPMPLPKQKSQGYWIAPILLVISIPWISTGSLGSWLDTSLMLAVGLLIGTIFLRLLEVLNPSAACLEVHSSSTSVWLEGLEMSALLILLMGSLSFPFGGVQLVALILFAGFGWMITLLKRAGVIQEEVGLPGDSPAPRFATMQNPLFWLVGVSTALPLVFLDPDELILILGMESGEVLDWAFLAAAASSALILVHNLLLSAFWIFRRRHPSNLTRLDSTRISTGRPALSILLYAGILLISSWIYIRSGHPGLHGEQMFVILANQADLSHIDPAGEAAVRREEVFKSLAAHAESSQQGLRKFFDLIHYPYKPYYLVNALQVPQNPFLRLWLLSRKDVDRILDDPVLRPLPEEPPVRGGSSPAPTTTLWNLSLIQADRAWSEFGVRGDGILIGQSDSGVQGDHPELQDSYRGLDGTHDKSWFDPWNGTTSPTDLGGHGTHTLGTILGNQTGVAPDAQWIGCVNLARNLGSPSHYLDCMQFMLAPFPQTGDPFHDGDPSSGAQILNNSWGCPEIEGCDALVFQPAVQALRMAGIFFVASAGNDGPICGSINVPPPIYAAVFAVGAIDRNGKLADFSSVGPAPGNIGEVNKPDMVAPGVSVLSSLPLNSYGTFSGTSMAGPHVAGTVALMWSANPQLIGDIDRSEQILIQAADPYLGEYPDCPGAGDYPSSAAGYGVLNAYEAVRLAIASP